MAECNNPDCLCQGVEPVDFRHVPNAHVDGRFGGILSRLEQACDDLGFLIDNGIGEDHKLHAAREQIDAAMATIKAEHRAVAILRGFTIRGGIGPGDWERK